MKAELGELAGDRAFTRSFFERYVEGRETIDFAPLMARAGLVVRPRAAGAAWLGNAPLTFAGGSGARVSGMVPFDSPLYTAGVAQDDQILAIDGVEVSSQAALDGVLRTLAPGRAVPIRFVRRGGDTVTGSLVVGEDPRIEIVPLEATGGTLTQEQQRFRQQWLAAQP
jgi:predicted metalloprotease with PDZ domain